ncbi:hypothetical protein N8I74_04680 [Chitiniphilus purpureus]|uniref:Transporter substrate-binding domain-containing protein n=1 Tax=Chitiniphilus purpureus TaxID=2981137 RepID=A0ABY6DPM0_9NEIS|nr:hypothetical protein [Chitiniphilus sp. CD1]UXY16319.1 hypothetical protein N8I74_04680 [Chitiniphilus sp. CD1]
MRRLLPMLALLIGLCSEAALLVAVPQDVLADYERLVAGRDVRTLRDYSGPGARRDTVEMILLQQALWLGGERAAVRFTTLNSYARILNEVEQGRVVAGGTSAWATDLSTRNIRLSRALIEEGEYVVGLYALAGNHAVLRTRPAQWRTLTAVTNRAWINDVATLQQLGVRHIESAPTFAMIARMLKAGRGDLTLASFKPTPDLSFEVEGITLTPLVGYKVAMPGSRHFPIAPTPRGERFARALDIGLARLRGEGRIRQAYEAGGFFNSRVAEWTLLDPRRTTAPARISPRPP